MVGAAPTAAKGRLSHRSAVAPRPAWSGATSPEPGRSGGLRALCALCAVLAVAIWPAAAHARITTGAAGDEQPRLWGVEVDANARAFARPTYLARMKHAGINAVVVDPRRLTLKELRATTKAAGRARLWVVEIVPPVQAKATRSVRAVRATCRAAHKPSQTLCAGSASLANALALASTASAEPMVAVRLARPGQVERLRGASSSGSRILALVRLKARGYAASEWRKAIAVAASASSLDLAVTPTSASSKTLSPYLNQLGKPPAAPGSFGVTGSTASTVSVAWTAVSGATEYDLTANGKFAGKTATTSFTVGGLVCNTAYKFGVTAKNANGKTSKASTFTTSTAPCSDVTPPSAPAGLTEVSASQTSVTVAWASSTDNVAVVGYSVYVDGTPAGTTANTNFTAGGLACGSTHTVAVDAVDAAGNHSTRTSMSASTSPCLDTTPPTVSVTSPAGGATVSGTVPVTATASDNVAVASVEFWVDGTKVATDTSAPYSYSWDTTQVAGGAHTLVVKAVDSSTNSTSATVGVTVSNSPCVTSSPSWQNTAMLSPDGTFDVAFDATPSAADIDAVTGLSATTALSYSDLAVTARFNSTGTIDAINGGAYAAANAVPYSGGSTYHFRAAVNVPNHSYSLYVTAPGKPETPVALNYAFRTGQTSVSALSDWAVTAADGSHQTCGLAVTNPNDMTAPNAPTGVAKTSSTQTSLSLSWAASTDNVGTTGYTVYVNGAASSAAAGTSRTVSGLSCGSTYTVGVDAYDAAGNHSAQTSTTMSTSACPDTTAPSTPTNLTKTGSTQTSLALSWSASTDNVGVTGYTLYVNGAQVGTTTGTSMSAAGLTCGTTYTVAVDAFDAAGNHSAKASISATAAACSDTTPPTTPTGLATSAVGHTSITLSWTASTDNVGVSGYRLYLGSSQVGTSSSISYVFSGLSCGTSYTLGVAALDAAGNVSGTATLSAAAAACSPPPPSGSCTTTISSGLATAIQSAAAGATICLNSGSYGNLDLTNVRKSADVTIRPVDSASATIGAVTLQNSSHLHFTGANGSLTVGSSTLDSTNTLPNCSDHITFDHLRFLGFGIFPRCASMAILVDHVNMDNLLPAQGGEGRINVQALNQGPAADQGITISNSTFNGPTSGWASATSNCAKGIQILGGAYGVRVIGDEFAREPDQGTCDPVNGIHIGGVQIYGGTHTYLQGNYFHDNGSSAGGLAMGDGDYTTAEDNVWVCSCIYPWSIQAFATQGSIFRHNTFAGGGGIHFQYQSGYPANNIIRDNVFTDPSNGITDSSGANWGTQDHNLDSGLSGLGDITGIALWSGGSKPTSYAGYHLAAGSPGKGVASDGLDMGIR
jgi:chitodextrinase